MKTASINNIAIGDGHPAYIVFEAGATHDGFETALTLAQHAARVGASAVKFQVLDPERLVSDNVLPFSYQILGRNGETVQVSEPLYDILMRRTLTRKEWRKLKTKCDEMGLAFFSTATFPDEVDFLVEIGCDTVKICSGDIDHFPLIRKAASTGVCVQLDTGNASLYEVGRAVDEARKAGARDVIVHNCPSGYPARLESINLRLIPSIKTLFDCPAAFSDHTPGWEMDIAAVALGANMLEKTITLDRATPSVEHIFSLEPPEMESFIRRVREVETALGTTFKVLSPEEQARSATIRRGILLARNVQKGEEVRPECLEYARPATGLRPEMTEFILGSLFKTDLPKGHRISLSDLH